VKLWEDLASVVGDVPVSELAYEIMNEPVADNPEDWNKLVALVSKAIRKTEPNRVLVIGANRWQIPQSVPLLKLPEGDKNIIISFHTYSPMLLTHYTADWIGLRDYKGPVNYPGVVAKTEGNAYLEKKQNDPADGHFVRQAAEEWNPERIYKEIEPAVIRAKELGLQLYCGEFGCLPTVPREMRLAYYHDIVSVFEKNGIAWANWEYKGDFGIFEWHGPKETLVPRMSVCSTHSCSVTDARAARRSQPARNRAISAHFRKQSDPNRPFPFGSFHLEGPSALRRGRTGVLPLVPFGRVSVLFVPSSSF
jgi:endoglucanase